MALRRSTAGALGARLLVVLAMTTAVACAGRGKAAAPQTAAATVGAPAPSGSSAPPAAGARVQQAAFSEDTDGARLVLSSNAPILYTAYEPRPDLLVVDLPGTGISDHFASPVATGTLVNSVKVESLTEMGKQVTRLSVVHREGIHFDIRSVGQGLALSFEGPDQLAAASAQQSAPPAAEKAPAAAPAPAPVVAASTPAPVVRTEEIRTASAHESVRGENAHVLEEVRASISGGVVTVSLLGDGTFSPKSFTLDNPSRVVIDLPGVKNEVRHRTMPVKSDLVSRIRVSQFQLAPDLVTRIVLDLTRPAPHALHADGERLAVIVGSAEAVAAAAAAMPAAPAPQPVATRAETPSSHTTSPSRTEVAASPAPETHVAEVKKTEPAAATPAPAKAETAAPETTVAAARPEPPPPAPAPSKPASMSESGMHSQADEAIRTASTKPASPSPSSVSIKPSSKVHPAPPKASPAPASRRDEALFEAAAAVLQQEEGARSESGAGAAPGSGAGSAQSSAFQPRTISEAQTQFTGEPISLDLKDADIKDVFRTISQLTQLNIVVDPEVRGTVTVQLEDVPWDQALDLILKQNALGYVLENNIMRIATTQKLQAEQADRARLAEARQAAEPTRTLVKKLSYARAGEITPTIKSVMSKRGDIVVDARTNTLIIREIPTFLPAVLQLIDQLDTATPQVMIESRIIETTKSLGRSLGITWGVGGSADVAHGNTTNLVFPNNITGQGNVGLGNGPSVLSVRMGNLLDTFSLDVALTAAENQGLLKIISSPKVAALTNTAASIQSGVQIPVQTNVNNTTTVIYVDATLRLTVTPQITNEGTILLDVQVSKREPAVALNLSLGQNVPLTIREYRGQILVRDGGTTVIGGIFQINDQDQNNMIPGVWKIPILGNLFRNKTRTEKHDELLIFITPRILRS
jgi:type IV pilus assembly protein PilQ